MNKTKRGEGAPILLKKLTRDCVDSVQETAREDRRTVTDLRNQLERLTEKMMDMEDKSRRNNVRLVGLPEEVEGSDVAGFLRVNLSFCYQQFFIYFFHTQHNIISKIQQNKTTDTYSTSQGPIKREGEREGQQEHKSYSFI